MSNLLPFEQRIKSCLIILLSVLFQKTQQFGQTRNIVQNKLIYGTRDKVHEFLNDFIYDNINSLNDYSWHDFITKYQNFDEQDIFYIFQAVQKLLMIRKPTQILQSI